mgnify:CR=1 FL=1
MRWPFAWLASHHKGGIRRVTAIAGWAFTGGVIMFEGSLYVAPITGDVLILGVAPAGGVLLVVGWCAIIAVGLKKN